MSCGWEKEEKEGQLALTIMMWPSEKEQVTSNEKQFIWIKNIFSWIIVWDPWVDLEEALWSAFREMKTMKVIIIQSFRSEIHFL